MSWLYRAELWTARRSRKWEDLGIPTPPSIAKSQIARSLKLKKADVRIYQDSVYDRIPWKDALEIKRLVDYWFPTPKYHKGRFDCENQELWVRAHWHAIWDELSEGDRQLLIVPVKVRPKEGGGLHMLSAVVDDQWNIHFIDSYNGGGNSWERKAESIHEFHEVTST